MESNEQPKALSKVDVLMSEVLARKKLINDTLPQGVNLERFIGQVRTAIASVPKLVACKPATVVKAVLNIAELGLDPTGRLGSAWIIPYGDTAQDIIGYRGLIELAHRSGEVNSIDAYVVHAKDEWDYKAGEIPYHRPFIARPGPDGKMPPEKDQDPGPMWAAWAVASIGPKKTKKAVVMSLRELDAIRAKSAAVKFNKKDSPWFTNPEEMYKKTVIRRLCKTLPLSPERARLLALALERDTEEYGGDPDEVQSREVNAAPVASKAADAAKERLRRADAPPPEVVEAEIVPDSDEEPPLDVPLTSAPPKKDPF